MNLNEDGSSDDVKQPKRINQPENLGEVRTPMNWRKIGFIVSGVLAWGLLAGLVVFLFISPKLSSRPAKPTLPPSATALASPSSSSQTSVQTPVQTSSATSSGQWITLPSTPPDQPTPSIPPGALIFKDPFGQLVEYVPPTAMSSPIPSKTYTNQQDGCSLSYPLNWIESKTAYKDHEGLTIYPPGTNINENVPGGPKGIIIGWTDLYQAPASNDSTVADMRSITIDGVTGQVYTVGALGKGIVAAFPRKGGYVLITSSLSGVETNEVEQDNLIINAFQQVLASLKFF